MDCGYVLIFKSEKDGQRYPSGIVHKTYDDAVAALKRRDQVGTPVAITTICWDETLPIPA
jgi:hypothetical protein